jgi:hypothetical protein
MATGRTRYELRVATLLSKAALAAIRIPVSTTTIPRSSVFRIRVPGDRDPSELVHRLTERDVEILEIRRCPQPAPRDPRTADDRPDRPACASDDEAAPDGGVVIPFPSRAGSARRRPGPGSAG